MPERHGLPDAYPYNEPGFCDDQAASARWVTFTGPTEQTVEVDLVPGRRYELWPGGALFNEHGTLIGYLDDAPTLAEFKEWRREKGFPDE
jgi:hypothetical protein